MEIVRFISRQATIVIAAALTAIAVLVGIPDANDYVMVTVDKHRRLATLAGPKIVFVGGSNLAYGLDSQSVDDALPYGVVNMGLNAYLGARFLLRETEGELRSGDVVVLSFEHRMFFTAAGVDFADGAGIDHLMVIKARPQSMAFLSTPAQVIDVVRAVPVVAQRKLERAGRHAAAWIQGDAVDEAPEVGTLEWVEGTRHAFNEYGDLQRHLDPRAVRPPFRDDSALSGQRLRDDVFAEIEAFRARMQARGITVVFAPPPTPRTYYQRQRAELDQLYDRLGAVFPDVARLANSPYLFDDAEFFDDATHLGTPASRARRTALVVDQLKRHGAGQTTRRVAGAGLP